MKNVSVHKNALKDYIWLTVLLRAGFIAPSYVPVGLINDLRYAARMRTTLTNEITRLKNRCHRVIDSVLVSLGLSVAFCRHGRETLLKALQGEYEGLTKEQQLAFDSVTKVEGLIIQDLLVAIEMNEERVKRYDVVLGTIVERLEAEKGDREVSLLATVPGMGLVTAISVKAEIGTVERFQESGRLSSYAGLAPRVMQSGEHRKIGQTIRSSNKHLRSAMFIAAQFCARFGPLNLQDFHRRIREKQGHKVATMALARKLLVIVWKMLKEKKPFEMAYNDGLAQRK